jgi:hypothetical protein
MKTILSKILELFAASNRSKMNNPAQREYCICGALKQVERPGRELSLKAESSPQHI